jgi:hypothetical protein
VASLAWEGTLYFFPPVLLGAWLLEALRGRASRRLTVLTWVTLGIFGAIASLWYAPVFVANGLWSHSNTPAVMLAETSWATAPSLFGGQVLDSVGTYVNSYSLVGTFGPLLFLGVLALPFILLLGETEDSLAFVWMSFGGARSFLFRAEDAELSHRVRADRRALMGALEVHNLQRRHEGTGQKEGNEIWKRCPLL